MAWTGYTTALCCKVSFSRPSARQFLGREGGCLPLENICTKTGRIIVEVLRDKQPSMRVYPMKDTTYAYFDEYKDTPKTVPLDFSKNEVMWVATKLSCATGPLQ